MGKIANDTLADLPPEVIAQLSSRGRMDSLETKIVAIVADIGGDVGLDPIIIELWRRHQVIETRQFIMAKLYRMALAGLVSRKPRAKGVYSVEVAP